MRSNITFNLLYPLLYVLYMIGIIPAILFWIFKLDSWIDSKDIEIVSTRPIYYGIAFVTLFILIIFL